MVCAHEDRGIPVAGRPLGWLPLRADSARARWILPATVPRVGEEFEIELRIEAEGDWIAEEGTAERLIRQWKFPPSIRLIEILAPVVEGGKTARFRLRFRAEHLEAPVRIPASTLAYFSPSRNRFLTLVVPAVELAMRDSEPFSPEIIASPTERLYRAPKTPRWLPSVASLAIGVSAVLVALWLRRIRGVQSTNGSRHASKRKSSSDRTKRDLPAKAIVRPARTNDSRASLHPMEKLLEELASRCESLPGQRTSEELAESIARVGRLNADEWETLRRDLADLDAFRFGGPHATNDIGDVLLDRLQSWLERLDAIEKHQSPSNSTSQ